MTVRLMLIAPALNPGVREARFAHDAPLDTAGVRGAAAVAAAGEVPAADVYAHGPSEPCRQTAEVLGLAACAEPRFGDWDLGRWSGRRLSEVSAAEPEAVSEWLADPSAVPHGGESLLQLTARVGDLLDATAAGTVQVPGSTAGAAGNRVLAVVEPAVVRAAVVHALALPVTAFWRLDVAPLGLTELSGRAGRWNLRCGRPLG
ncbi:histidine phosphatase family protein [Streptomyces griseus]|uniref:histidine phosphatase family protein n=1 Tax=Streptomyces griseus TaxID=1911 RepID=UPI000840580A|nr:histidine phosphatase family protein [Streptomyces griseus]